MYFDVYFSVSHGLEIDFPFFGMTVSTSVLGISVLAIVALRVRKVFIQRSRASVKTSNVEIDNGFDFDWNK